MSEPVMELSARSLDDVTRPASASRWRVRVSPLVRDVLLLVLGAVIALVADEWRDSRAHAQRAAVVRESLRAELEANRQAVEWSRAHHLRMADSLSVYADQHLPPPRRLYVSGIFNPAAVSATAWLAARESGALTELPYPAMLRIAAVYERQASYRALSDAIGGSLMTDLLRDGEEPVLRDRAPHFIVLERDFANRERVLERAYEDAEAQLADTARR
jgi:hypothetical protein